MQLRCGNRSLVIYYSACMTEPFSKDIQVLIILDVCVLQDLCDRHDSGVLLEHQRAFEKRSGPVATHLKYQNSIEQPESRLSQVKHIASTPTCKLHLTKLKYADILPWCTVHKKNIYNPAGFTHSQPRNIKYIYTAHIFFRKKKGFQGTFI